MHPDLTPPSSNDSAEDGRRLRGKESTCQCRRCGFRPSVGKIPWQRKWQPTPGFLPGTLHGHRSLAGCSAWGHKKSDTTEWLSIHDALVGRMTYLKSVTPAQVSLPLVGAHPTLPTVSCPRSERLGCSGFCTIASKGHYWGAKETQGEACFKSKMLRCTGRETKQVTCPQDM